MRLNLLLSVLFCACAHQTPLTAAPSDVATSQASPTPAIRSEESAEEKAERLAREEEEKAKRAAACEKGKQGLAAGKDPWNSYYRVQSFCPKNEVPAILAQYWKQYEDKGNLRLAYHMADLAEMESEARRIQLRMLSNTRVYVDMSIMSLPAAWDRQEVLESMAAQHRELVESYGATAVSTPEGADYQFGISVWIHRGDDTPQGNIMETFAANGMLCPFSKVRYSVQSKGGGRIIKSDSGNYTSCQPYRNLLDEVVDMLYTLNLGRSSPGGSAQQ